VLSLGVVLLLKNTSMHSAHCGVLCHRCHRQKKGVPGGGERLFIHVIIIRLRHSFPKISLAEKVDVER